MSAVVENDVEITSMGIDECLELLAVGLVGEGRQAPGPPELNEGVGRQALHLGHMSATFEE